MHVIHAASTKAYQLSKEDEASLGEEVQVKREDQDKINRFSRLHQRELTLKDQLEDNKVRQHSFGASQNCGPY